MVVYEYQNYFENIARNYRKILHNPEEDRKRFTTGNIEELLGGLKDDLNLSEPCLILYNFEGRFLENDGEAKRLLMQSAFAIVQDVEETDFEDMDKKSDELFEIGSAIIGKMLHDRELHAAGKNCPSFISTFSLDSVKSTYVGRIGDSSYGWLFEFDIQNSANELLTYREEEWNE